MKNWMGHKHSYMHLFQVKLNPWLYECETDCWINSVSNIFRCVLSCTVGTGGSFHGGRAVGAWSWPVTSI